MNEEKQMFNGDELAISVWKSKYAADGELHYDDMHKRLAREFARIESNYISGELLNPDRKKILSDYGQNRVELTENRIYNLFKDFKYIVPQGRVMSGLGVKDSYRSLSNCLRLPNPKDSYSSIMYIDTMLVSSAKRGCGYGLGLSNLRPQETKVSNAAKTSTGAISFMERYSNSTREVGQNSRRGACLLDLEINHPDSLDFMTIKNDLTKVTGANISLFFNDEFMKAVENDEDYILRFPCTEEHNTEDFDDLIYDKLYPYMKGFVKKIRAKEYWNTFCNSALKFAEPGCFFRTRFNNYSPSNVYDKYRENGTNACGEQPMADFDTCRLIVQNLFSIVKNPFTKNAEIDYDLLYKISYETQRLGDDLVDLEIEYIDRIINKIKSDDIPLEEKQIELTLWEKVKDMAQSGRRTGCGITGLADMLAALNLKYDSDKALDIIDKVMSKKLEAELDCSIDLSILRGTFEGWDSNIEFKKEDFGSSYNLHGNNDFYNFIIKEFPNQAERMYKYGRRNINLNTIAPCGSTSILTQTSSGCEPVFMPFYSRRKKINPGDNNIRVDFIDQNGDSWQEFSVLHPKFKDWININFDNLGMSGFEDLNNLDKDFLQKSFEKSPWYKSTANDIDWKKRVQIQGILQKYTTSAISSTLNLPGNTTLETVSSIYLESWKQGLKGQTIYVEGSRSGVLVDNNKQAKTTFNQNDAPKRPKELKGQAYVTSIKGEKFNVIVGLLDDKPYEVFAFPSRNLKGEGLVIKQGKSEYNFIQLTESNSNHRVLTDCMNDEQASITRLISTGLRHGTKIDFLVDQLNKTNGDLTSFSKAISRILSKFVETREVGNCPECKIGKIIRTEGCEKCSSCSYSKC